jgi:hypothetical protein
MIPFIVTFVAEGGTQIIEIPQHQFKERLQYELSRKYPGLVLLVMQTRTP